MEKILLQNKELVSGEEGHGILHQAKVHFSTVFCSPKSVIMAHYSCPCLFQVSNRIFFLQEDECFRKSDPALSCSWVRHEFCNSVKSSSGVCLIGFKD